MKRKKARKKMKKKRRKKKRVKRKVKKKIKKTCNLQNSLTKTNSHRLLNSKLKLQKNQMHKHLSNLNKSQNQ